MGKYASGRFAKRISDRSGLAFPYNEMVQEWNGSWVHTSEFEPKHPQLDPPSIGADAEILWRPRPDVPAPTTGQGYAIVSNPVNSAGISAPIMWAENSDTIGSMYIVPPSTGSVGEINPFWNYVPDITEYKTKQPNAVHFSLGGPWLEGYEDCPFSKEWYAEKAHMDNSNIRTLKQMFLNIGEYKPSCLIN